MYSGGIADKLGNRYEAKWLVRQFLDVIAGKADWVRFEGITAEFGGFEFAIERDGVTEWHQTKINSPSGNWTINALKTEGVLAAFKTRLKSSNTAKCVFVSQDGAKDLRTLVGKSKIARTPKEYLDGLSIEQTDKGEQLKKAWDCSTDQVFDWLRRTKIVVMPDQEIEQFIESYGELYFADGGKASFPELRDYLEKNFNQQISTEIARHAMRTETSLTIKDWQLTPTIKEKLINETAAYLNTYTPFGAGGSVITRHQATEILDEIVKPDGVEIVLLTGVAGAGKSGVVRSVLRKLKEHQITHLAFRVDHHLSCSTAQEFGKHLTQQNESPVTTLKGIEPKNTSVLVIDQVDAISEVSGRDGAIREAILRMVKDASYFRTVRIVLICRTFDFQSDARFKALENTHRTKVIEVPLLNWDTEVSPLFKDKGICTDRLFLSQKELLCLPVNLAIFFELDEPDFNFRTQSDLLESLLDKKAKDIRNVPNISWPLIDPLKTVTQWMSDHQVLNAPESLLDIYSGASDVLASEGLIIKSRGQVNFFHESLFDYLYARTFVTDNKSLVELLMSTEQHLFRRTQTRQILQALRQNDPARYYLELEKVLSSDQIRYHIQYAVAQWLGSLENPTDQEFSILASRDNNPETLDPLANIAFLSSPYWFDLLARNGWIQKQIAQNQEKRKNPIFWWLSNIAGDRPKAVADILRSWWGSNPDKAAQLVGWFGTVSRKKPDKELLALCRDVIMSKPADLFGGRDQERIMSLLSIWGEEQPEYSAEIVKGIFDCWYSEHPGHQPFEREGLKEFDLRGLGEIANKSPEAFLSGTTDAFIRAIQIINEYTEQNPMSYHFRCRTQDEHRYGVDEFIGMYKRALCTLAKTDPEIANDFLDQLNARSHETLLHFHLEVISANGKYFAKKLIKHINDPNIFNAGWRGANWKSFADAAGAAMSHLDCESRSLIEKVVYSNREEIDRAARAIHEINKQGESEPWDTRKGILKWDLNRSGYTQWCILETIGLEQLSQEGQQRLGQLRRKFPNIKPEQPSYIRMRSIASPINRHDVKKMSDSCWLKAIKRYDNNEDRIRGSKHIIGGARDLAGELQEVTKNNPARFVRLLDSIPDTAHHTYIERLLWGLAESELTGINLIQSAVSNAHERPGHPYGSEICRLFGNFPSIAQHSETFKILLWYIDNGDAAERDETEELDNSNQITSISDLMDNGLRLYVQGSSGTRGSAIEALEKVLWENPELAPNAWKILDRRIEEEAVDGVRCSMMAPLTPLYNDNKERCAQYIERLIADRNSQKKIDENLFPLISHHGTNILPYIIHWVPASGIKLIKSLLDANNTTMQLVGAWHMFRLCFQQEEYLELANTLMNKSTEHRRLMAGVAARAIHFQEGRKEAEKLLMKFFHDKDINVRQHAGNTFRHIKGDEFWRFKELARAYIKSPAFHDEHYSFYRALEEAATDVLGLVIDATEKTIANIKEGEQHHGRQYTDFHHLEELLKYEYRASEGNPSDRKKILDIIDSLLYLDIHGGESIAKAYDR